MKKFSFLLLSSLIVIAAFAAEINNAQTNLVFTVQMAPVKNVKEIGTIPMAFS